MSRLNRRSFLFAAATAPLAVGAVASPARAAMPRAGSGIEPLTEVTQSPPGGYFSDLYPISRAGGSAAAPAFSGSPKSILVPSGALTPGSYTSEPLGITVTDALVAEAAAAGATFRPGAAAPNVWSENNNITRDGSGRWQMATTLRVSNASDPDTDWTVIVHARPVGGPVNGIPTSWTADTLLVGSYDTFDPANYCGKYVEDCGRLYLTYSKRLTPEPNATNGIVAQPMVSVTEPADVDPTVLIHPDGLKSELFFGLTQPPNFRITETGNVVRIGDVYVMAYSAGAFDRDTYKTGLAFSDTFSPAAGSTYKKILEIDSDGVWGTPGSTEVRYLMQTQMSNWPNYVAGQVLSPGVPSIRRVGGDWYLFFAGYRPDDAPVESGTYDASHRRPFYVRLKVSIPSGATVAGTSGYDLAGWITSEA